MNTTIENPIAAEIFADQAVDSTASKLDRKLLEGGVVGVGTRNPCIAARAYRAESPTLWFWSGGAFCYDESQSRYRLVATKTLAADIRLWLNERFARQAEWLQQNRFANFPKQVVARAVDAKFVGEVIDSLEAEFRLPESVTPGATWIPDLGDEGEWTTVKDTLPVANGLLHIESGYRSDLDENTFNLTTVAAEFELDAQCPKWEAFLERTFAGTPDESERIARLQEFMGAILMPSNTWQRIYVLVGVPQSGKGTVTRVITGLLGAEHVSAEAFSSFGDTHALSSAVNALLVFDAELEGGEMPKAALSKLKKCAGGDSFPINPKHRDIINLRRAPFNLLACSNGVPEKLMAVPGMSRRIEVVIFPNAIKDGEVVREYDQELLKERSGILRWAIEGLKRLMAEGTFTVAPSSRDWTTQQEVAGCPVRQWLTDDTRVVAEPGAQSARSDRVYESFRKFCQESGEVALPKATFGTRLKSLVPGLELKPVKEGGVLTRRYTNIRLVDEPAAADPKPAKVLSIYQGGKAK